MTSGLATLAVGAAYAFKQFENAEKVQNQTAAVLKSTGGAAKVSAQHVEDLAQSISRMTGIDDEAIQAGENLLLTFTNIRNEVGAGNDIFDQATQTITDMSVALGQDFKSSAIQVGKALQDPILGMTALRRVGVSFTAQQVEMVNRWVEHGKTLKAQKFILAELTREFGGSAAAQKTATGSMMTELGNLAETIGGLVAPAFERLIVGMQVVVDYLMTNAGPAFQAMADWFRKVWAAIGPVVTSLGRDLVEAGQQVWAVFSEKVLPSLKRLWEAAKPVLKVVGALVAIALKLALEVLPVLFDALATQIEIMSRVAQVIGKLIEWVSKLIMWVKDRLVSAWNVLKDVVLTVWGAIKSAAFTAINAIISGLNLLIGAINRVQDALDVLAGPGINFEHVGTIPPLGGHATGSTLPGGEPNFTVPRALAPRLVVTLDRRRFSDALDYDATYRGW